MPTVQWGSATEEQMSSLGLKPGHRTSLFKRLNLFSSQISCCGVTQPHAAAHSQPLSGGGEGIRKVEARKLID